MTNDNAIDYFMTNIISLVGKTTILYKLKLGEIVTTIPTIGKVKVILSIEIIPNRFSRF